MAVVLCSNDSRFGTREGLADSRSHSTFMLGSVVPRRRYQITASEDYTHDFTDLFRVRITRLLPQNDQQIANFGARLYRESWVDVRHPVSVSSETQINRWEYSESASSAVGTEEMVLRPDKMADDAGSCGDWEQVRLGGLEQVLIVLQIPWNCSAVH